MPGIRDWIGKPLYFLSSNLDQFSVEQYKEKTSSFFTKSITSSEESKQWIPSFNSTPQHDIKPNSLVRYRCMVQDMFGPEYYYDVFETENTATGEKKLVSGRYQDVTNAPDGVDILHDSAATRTAERQVFYCVPIPGESDWVKQGHKSMCMSPRVAGGSSTVSKVKRSLDEEENCGSEEAMDTQPLSEVNKRSRPTANGDSAVTHTNGESKPPATQFELNFPLPGEKGPAALVKMYDGLGDSMKINDIIEVYGVISTDPALSQVGADDIKQISAISQVAEFLPLTRPKDMDFVTLDNNCQHSSLFTWCILIKIYRIFFAVFRCSTEMLTIEEQKAHNPPPSLVPRIHAVYVNKLQSANPLVLTQSENCNQLESAKAWAEEIREHLLALLEHVLCGDKLCAEYLLIHLLSSVHMRRDMLAVGSLSLNITKVPQNDRLFTDSLVDLIQQFVTSLYYLPMTLDNMNKLNFTPVKDYEANRLKAGILQLADRCHLVLDETAMQPGQLDVNGVKNLTALGNLIRWQKVTYDFKYHQQDFNADVPVLTLSEGKSLLTSTTAVPLQANAELPLQARLDAIKTYLTPDLLDRIRLYMTLIPTIGYEMSEDMTKMVQEDFVSVRQADKNAMTAEDLQSLLVISRILSISYGRTDMSADIWSRAKLMETERKLRLSS